MKSTTLPGAAVMLVLALAACDGKPSAVAPGGGASSALPSTEFGVQASAQDARDPRDLPIPQINGKPLWAPNRKHTAEENAAYQFSRNGGEFKAESETAYVGMAHTFIEKPPRDVETLDRPNGDKLMYDAKGNIFVVVARNGAPRTMFKPRAGAAYWAQQKQRESKRPTGGQDTATVSDQG
jgi:pyocin large subunit-like protein